ncbi:MAG: tyrosine-type recombinase/integrase, partial [Nocardioides sp.]
IVEVLEIGRGRSPPILRDLDPVPTDLHPPARRAHPTLRSEEPLNEAVRREVLPQNPAKVARAPRLAEEEVEPYTVDEVQLLFAAASQRRNTARWVLALVLGLRQGEVLGLQWDDVDEPTRTLRTSRSRLRPRYEHGCESPCGKKHAGYCPQRVGIRPDTDTTKSRAGRRRLGLPDELLALLMLHREQQDAERRAAGQLWDEGDWLFADERGRAINPRTDWTHWKQLLAEAGVRDGRLHDARHTAATVLHMLGVSERSMMGLMGWSNTAMASRYAHMVDPVRHDVAEKLGRLLWRNDTPT